MLCDSLVCYNSNVKYLFKHLLYNLFKHIPHNLFIEEKVQCLKNYIRISTIH